jgi:hypothetical protein
MQIYCFLWLWQHSRSKIKIILSYCEWGVYNKLHYWVNSQSIHSYYFVMIFDKNVKNLAKIRQILTI